MFSALLFLSFVHLFFFSLSFYRIRTGTKRVQFIYHWAFPYSAFIWEDLLIFSFLYFLITITTLAVRDLRIGILALLLFLSVRSLGETIYFFLQQFHRPKHHPHQITNHFQIFDKILKLHSPQKSYIIMQIFHQSLLTIFLVSLTLLLLNWNSLNWYF